MQHQRHSFIFWGAMGLFVGMGALCNDNQSMRNAITIQITATPLTFSMAEREDFRVGLVARNTGKTAIDPKIYQTELSVGTAPSMAWNLAVGNGPREDAWWNLPPGASISESWPLGDALFAAPGEYILTLRLGEQESSIQVHVTP